MNPITSQSARTQNPPGAADKNALRDRAYLASELVRSNTEARLYRGLFWILLSIAAAGTMLHLLQK